MAAAPYGLARVITVLITAVIWFFLLLVSTYIFVSPGGVAHVSPLAMANTAGLTMLFIPFFTTQSILVGMLDGLLRQRFFVDEAPPDPSARPVDPWRTSLIHGLVLGVPAAALGYYVAGHVPVDTLSPGAFALRLACAGTVLCAIAAFVTSGKPFLHETRVAPEQRRFTGSAEQYLTTRFVLPHTIANAVINAAIAFALAPFPSSQVGAVVPTLIVVGDTLITLWVLIGILTPGVMTHARVDASWGIAPPMAAGGLSKLPSAVMPVVFGSMLFTAIVGVAFWLLKLPGLTPLSWAIYRGVLFGLFCAWYSKRIAGCVLRAAANPAPSTADSASPSTT